MRKLYIVTLKGTVLESREFRWTVIDDDMVDYNELIQSGTRYNEITVTKFTIESFNRLNFLYNLNEARYVTLLKKYRVPTLKYDEVIMYLDYLRLGEKIRKFNDEIICTCSECSKGKE